MGQNIDTDMSLRDLILKLNDYFLYLKKYWKIILILSLLCSVLFVILNVGQTKKYSAHLSFMLNVDESGLNSGISTILGQIGLGVSATETNLDKILELSKARIISESVLLDSLDYNNNKDLLANHLIIHLEENNTWSQSSILSFTKDSLSLKDFRFSHSKLSGFELLENKAIKSLHQKLVGSKDVKPMFTADYDELTGIMLFTVTCANEELAIIIVKNIFDKLSQYYIDKSTEKQQYEYEILKEKYDSINYLLSNIQYDLAIFEDSNKALFRKKDLLRKSKLKVDEQKLQFISAKAEEQLQIAKITLDNKTPYIQLIDLPISPIKENNMSLLFYAFWGFLLAFLTCVLFLGAKKMFSDIINQKA